MTDLTTLQQLGERRRALLGELEEVRDDMARAVALGLDNDLRPGDVAEALGISRQAVYDLLNRHTGPPENLIQNGKVE